MAKKQMKKIKPNNKVMNEILLNEIKKEADKIVIEKKDDEKTITNYIG